MEVCDTGMGNWVYRWVEVCDTGMGNGGGRFVTLVLGKGEVGVVIQVLGDGWVR